jgi:hypothetical protein
MLKKLALAVALAAAPITIANAEFLPPGQAKTTVLADCYANVYYTVAEGAYQVVTTVAPDAEHGGRPMRFVSRLADGESQEISIGGYGEKATLSILTISRMGDRVSLEVHTRPVSWRQKISANSAN